MTQGAIRRGMQVAAETLRAKAREFREPCDPEDRPSDTTIQAWIDNANVLDQLAKRIEKGEIR